MQRVPKAWMFTLGLSVLAVVAALAASMVRPAPEASVEADSCFRYGRLECCVKD